MRIEYYNNIININNKNNNEHKMSKQTSFRGLGWLESWDTWDEQRQIYNRNQEYLRMHPEKFSPEDLEKIRKEKKITDIYSRCAVITAILFFYNLFSGGKIEKLFSKIFKKK